RMRAPAGRRNGAGALSAIGPDRSGVARAGGPGREPGTFGRAGPILGQLLGIRAGRYGPARPAWSLAGQRSDDPIQRPKPKGSVCARASPVARSRAAFEPMFAGPARARLAALRVDGRASQSAARVIAGRRRSGTTDGPVARGPRT